MNSKTLGGLFLFFFCAQLLSAQTVFRGAILNETTQQPIANAKIGLENYGTGLRSDANGRFSYRKYHQIVDENSTLIISAPNYQSVVIKGDNIRQLFNKTTTIYLTPETSNPKKSFADYENITVFWDVSASAKNRNTQKELDFLRNFAASFDALKLRLVTFNNAIVVDKTFDISAGDISDVEQFVGNQKYIGATDYDLLKVDDTDAILLFSDGKQTFGRAVWNRDIPVYSVTSTHKVNHESLMALADFHDGYYLPLATFKVDQLIKAVKNNTALDYTYLSRSAPTVRGVIRSDAGTVQGATIMIKGSLETYTSKADGSYEVPAVEGDILQVKYLGMYPKEMLIPESGELDVVMTLQDELLEEVILSGNKSKAEEVNTGFGRESRNKLGFNVNTVTAKEIRPGALYLSDVIRGRFAGVQVSGFGSDATYLIRGVSSINNQLPPIWVVDGTVYTDVPVFLDPQNVASISILKSVNAAVRYGTIATGGAFIVLTKAANPEFVKKLNATNTALVKGNDYDETESLASLDSLAKTPNYIKQLSAVDGVQKQYERYRKLAPNYETSVAFFSDMALYFEKLDDGIAEKIRLDLGEICGTNVNALRILAYLYDSAERYTEAAKIYERILELAPGEAQSYRDLALAYQDSGSYNKALELYINMLGEQVKGVDFKGVENALGNELRRLVARHRDQMDFQRLPNEWLSSEYKLDIRMVIEYSDNRVPFEFQFVDPNKKYFKWQHTLIDNKERLKAEQKAGFQMEEFIIDDAAHGLWQINIQYLDEGEQFSIPPFLKFVIYRDYGTRFERKEIKVIKLNQHSDKVILGTLLL